MPSLISVIIPCRNEKTYIEKCLNSIINQDYPKDNLEVLMIDGMSEDGTREIIKNYSEKYNFIRLLENPQKFTPFGLNLGIKEARGEIIVRMDAHAGYEKDYISKCVRYLKESGADNVGGIIKTLPAKEGIWAKAIAVSLSHPFAVASFFRKGSQKPRFVDTVFGGCYKKEVFEKIGLFNENLVRSQDLEFNLRLKRAGGKILLAPDIIAFYFPQATFFDFLKHNFSDGVWATFPLKFGVKFTFRHFLPLIFISSILGAFLLSLFSKIFLYLFLFIIFLYFSVSIFFSFEIALKEKDFRFFFVLPIVFASRHFGYGLGSAFGLIKTTIG